MMLKRLSILITGLLVCANTLAAECIPTPPMFIGTHHKEDVPHKVDISRGLIVSGRVMDTGCQPVPRARIKHWQANTAGKYVDELRAYMFSKEDGSFQFETEWPGAPIAHIHFMISVDGYRPLTTQWVGDEIVNQIELQFIMQKE